MELVGLEAIRPNPKVIGFAAVSATGLLASALLSSAQPRRDAVLSLVAGALVAYAVPAGAAIEFLEGQPHDDPTTTTLGTPLTDAYPEVAKQSGLEATGGKELEETDEMALYGETNRITGQTVVDIEVEIDSEPLDEETETGRDQTGGAG